jgi:16S rRNA (guanine527-N7)-methyltransferase
VPGTDPVAAGRSPSGGLSADPSPAPAEPAAPPPPPPAASPRLLDQLLEEARAAGFLGPGPLGIQFRHAEGFVVVCRRLWPDGAAPPVLLDLGSGGGLPGLVVATSWPEASLVLLESNGRRTAFLREAVRRLGLEHRVSVHHDRAEFAGRDPEFRGRVDGVLARSFGRPAVVAECGAPLLKPGGWLIVSEPPRDIPGGPGDAPGRSRWPAEPLRQLGLEPEDLVRVEFDYQTLRQAEACPDRFPRRDGVPAKRPLF